MKCPTCGANNVNQTRYCEECGTEIPGLSNIIDGFSAKYSRTNLYDDIRYTPSRTNNYRTARLIGTLLKLAAWLSFGSMVLSGIAAIGAYNNASTQFGLQLSFDFFFFIFSIFFNLTTAALFLFMSEGINLVLDTEANTRQTAKTLERILRSQNA